MTAVKSATSDNPWPSNLLSNNRNWRSDAWHFPEESVLKDRLEVCRQVCFEIFNQDLFVDDEGDMLPRIAREFASREIPKPIFYGILALRAQKKDPIDLYDKNSDVVRFWHKVVTDCANENEVWKQSPSPEISDSLRKEKTVAPQAVEENAVDPPTSVAPTVTLETSVAELTDAAAGNPSDEKACVLATSAMPSAISQPAVAALASAVIEKPKDEKPRRTVLCCDLGMSIQKLWARVFG